jgi:transcriptional regulator with XRE-family HTH domain
MSQTALAGRLSSELGKTVDPTTVTRLESGKRPMLVAELVALAVIFETSPAELLPAGSPIAAEMRRWQLIASNRSRDADNAQQELDRRVLRLRAAERAVVAYRNVLEYKRTGAAAPDLIADLKHIAALVVADTASFLAVLADAGISESLIDDAVKYVDRYVAKEARRREELLPSPKLAPGQTTVETSRFCGLVVDYLAKHLTTRTSTE